MLLKIVFDVESNLDIENIMFDSRIPLSNSIFFAMKGKINDGHKFIGKAIENGAKCIVHTDDINLKEDRIVYIQVEDAYKAYIDFCNAFYGYPLNDMNVIGITGTNGKTTISWIIRSIISKFRKCGYIGTMGYYFGEKIIDSNLNLTTPKSDELFRIGKQMKDYGCKALVLEASSEGLMTRRLDGVNFSTAVFNNLSQEHMDVHGNMEDYFKAKCLLFDKLNDDGVGIINIDDTYGKRLFETLNKRKVSYAIDQTADYQAINLHLYHDHSEFDLLYQNKTYPIVTNMVASFNIYNLLANIAVLNENGYSIESILPYLNKVELTPGRCQLVSLGQGFNVVIDYAFTPNSFDKVFSFAESITDRGHQIIAVFGAAGDRDHNRRPGTAAVADKRASHVILSYDDPASEDMMDILLDLKSYFHILNPEIELNRELAIDKAVQYANSGDTILLLGKGNDEFFLDKKGRIPYIGDYKAASNAIKKKSYK